MHKSTRLLSLSLSTLSLLAPGCGQGLDAPVAEDEAQELQAQSVCNYRVKIDELCFTSGQGATEGDGEFEVLGEAFTSGKKGPSGQYTIAVGNCRSIGYTLLSSTSVTNTKAISIWSKVTEIDNGGFNGTNDVGEKSGTMTLDCASSLVFKTLTVNLYKNNGTGNQNGTATVKFKGERL